MGGIKTFRVTWVKITRKGGTFRRVPLSRQNYKKTIVRKKNSTNSKKTKRGQYNERFDKAS